MGGVRIARPTGEQIIEELRQGALLFNIFHPFTRFAYNVNQRFYCFFKKTYFQEGRSFITIPSQDLNRLWSVLQSIIEAEYARHSTVLRCAICGYPLRFQLTYHKGFLPGKPTKYVLYTEGKGGFHYWWGMRTLLIHLVDYHEHLLRTVYQFQGKTKRSLYIFLMEKLEEQIGVYLDRLVRYSQYKRAPSSLRLQHMQPYATPTDVAISYPNHPTDTINRTPNSFTSLSDEDRERLRNALFGFPEYHGSFGTSALRTILENCKLKGVDDTTPRAVKCLKCNTILPDNAQAVVLHMAENHKFSQYDESVPGLLLQLRLPTSLTILDACAGAANSVVYEFRLGLMTSEYAKVLPLFPPHLDTVGYAK